MEKNEGAERLRDSLLENPPIYFYSPTEKYHEFSNFHRSSIEIDDITYPTTEHYFQAMKFSYDGASRRSLKYSRIISKQSTPFKAKILANQQKTRIPYKWAKDLNVIIDKYSDVSLRPDWESVKDEVMRVALYHKFTQHEDLMELLVSTTGDLIENASNDSYWGIGDGTGRNMLGVLLTELRDRLKQNE